ncbi:MAG: hypothetical protein J0L92_41550, partial [Deltaproteobacteria bacterium]|nr:hypothetical protein [Deltaproteobacteria bacterium]
PSDPGPRAASGALFTYDALSTVDADFAIANASGLAQPFGNPCVVGTPDTSKRGFLRGIYDGRYRFARYFAPDTYNRPASFEALVRDSGVHAHFHRGDAIGPLAPAVELALHRIARESLHNAARHAHEATRIDVRLETDADRVRLTVRDDGRGSSATRGSGFGLVGMKERALLLGGTLEAGPLPSRGWQVEAILPRDGREGAQA